MKSAIWQLCPPHWRHANSGYQRLRRSPDKLRQIRRTVPLSDYIKLLSLYSFLRPTGQVQIAPKDVPSPLTLRYDTSDRSVYEQVFVEKQYEFPELDNVEFIIDAGANIGLASVYLLTKYPKAQVIAIEPDPENLAIAELNLRPFGSRCHLIEGAIWHTSSSLSIQRSDQGHWATSVSEETNRGDSKVQGFTINEITSRFGFDKIDLLKVDIEGAELPLFRDGDTTFLQKTRCCAVECHDAESLQAFESACGRDNFCLTVQGELTVATQFAAEMPVTVS